MRDSERYRDQAEVVLRLADKAASAAEKQVYLDIAEAWRMLAEEARRHEGGTRALREDRSFEPPERGGKA